MHETDSRFEAELSEKRTPGSSDAVPQTSFVSVTANAAVTEPVWYVPPTPQLPTAPQDSELR